MVEGCSSPEDYWWNRGVESLYSAKSEKEAGHLPLLPALNLRKISQLA